MGLSSLQVCMDPADWLQVQATMEDDETGLIMDSSSSLSPSSGVGGDHMLAAACSRPAAAALMERRLRPPHDQALKCPRCESTHTKFCYYNNYSLTQPRYFCKTCRRYWTKGGTLRNIPVGGGCRKSKKPKNNKSSNSSSATSSPSTSSHHHHDHLIINNDHNHFNSLLLGNMAGDHLMMNNVMAEPIDLLETKLEAIVGSSRINNYDFMGSGSGNTTINDHQSSSMGLGGLSANFHGMGFGGIGDQSGHNNNYATVAAGMSFMETCQRLMLPYDHHHNPHNSSNNNNNNNVDVDHYNDDVKPTTAKLLSLESWHDQQEAAAAGNGSSGTSGFGYLNGTTNALGSWNHHHHNSSISATATATPTTTTTTTTTTTAVNHHHHNNLRHHHLMMNGYGSSTTAAATNPLV